MNKLKGSSAVMFPPFVIIKSMINNGNSMYKIYGFKLGVFITFIDKRFSLGFKVIDGIKMFSVSVILTFG